MVHTSSGSASDALQGVRFAQYQSDRHNKHSVCVCLVCTSECVFYFVYNCFCCVYISVCVSACVCVCVCVCVVVWADHTTRGRPGPAAWSWWSEPHTCWTVTSKWRRGVEVISEWGKEEGRGKRKRSSTGFPLVKVSLILRYWRHYSH